MSEENKEMQDEKAATRIVWERDGKEMCSIAGGDFLMGNDEGKDNEHPIHTVTVDAFTSIGAR